MKNSIILKVDAGLGASAIVNRDLYKLEGIYVDTVTIWEKKRWTEQAMQEYMTKRDNILPQLFDYYQNTLDMEDATWNWMGYVIREETVQAARRGDEQAENEILAAILDCIMLSDRPL